MKKLLLNLDDIDALVGKEENRFRKTILRIQKKCPLDNLFSGGPHLLAILSKFFLGK